MNEDELNEKKNSLNGYKMFLSLSYVVERTYEQYAQQCITMTINNNISQFRHINMISVGWQQQQWKVIHERAFQLLTHIVAQINIVDGTIRLRVSCSM